MLLSSLRKALSCTTHHPDLLEVMEYAVFPPGKMFRPRLVEALKLDIGPSNDDYLHLSSAIELHHAYTLVHDDLPSMDNDLVRRGRPSTHVAFGEWKAVLAGDALLIASFDELMKIKSSRIREIHRLFSWATGAKGLISGQFLDLGAKGKASFSEVIRIHELKTARLIQVATLGSYMLSASALNLKSQIEYLRLGREIGLTFQLLDDLTELTDELVSDHEREINPFLLTPKKALDSLQLSIGRLRSIIKKNNLIHLEEIINDYLKKSQQKLLNGQIALEKHMGPTMLSTDFQNWITNFASA
jgi:geranylgeranyl pyrophosphate synthase